MYAADTLKDWISPHPGTGLAPSQPGCSPHPLGGLDHRGGSRMSFAPFLQMFSEVGVGLSPCSPSGHRVKEGSSMDTLKKSVKRRWLKSKCGHGVCQWCVHHLVTSKDVGSAALGGMGMVFEDTGPGAWLFLRHGLMVVINWGNWGVTVL